MNEEILKAVLSKLVDEDELDYRHSNFYLRQSPAIQAHIDRIWERADHLHAHLENINSIGVALLAGSWTRYRIAEEAGENLERHRTQIALIVADFDKAVSHLRELFSAIPEIGVRDSGHLKVGDTLIANTDITQEMLGWRGDTVVVAQGESVLLSGIDHDDDVFDLKVVYNEKDLWVSSAWFS